MVWEWAACLGSFLEEPGPVQTPTAGELGWGQMNPPAFNSGPRLPSTFPAFPTTPNPGSLEGSPAASRWWSTDAETQVSLLGIRKGGQEGKVQVTETEQMRASLCPDCAGKCGQGLPGTSKTLSPSSPPLLPNLPVGRLLSDSFYRGGKSDSGSLGACSRSPN